MVVSPDHFNEVPHSDLTEKTYTDILHALAAKPQHLTALLADLHPADIANLLERLPRNTREPVLAAIPHEHLGDVIAELEEGVQQHVLSVLAPEEIRHAIADLDSDDAADVAQLIEEMGEESLGVEGAPRDGSLLSDHQSKRLLEYDYDTAGGLMQVEVVTALPTRTVAEMMDYLRTNRDILPDNPGSIFVVNEHRKLLGTISQSRLLKGEPKALLVDIMRRDPLNIDPEAPDTEVVKIFEKYDINNLAVVNKKGQLLGRINVHDVLDVVMTESARSQARAAGVDETEDLFAPATETTRHRLPWLGINLLTAVAAAAVIALFETSIAQLTTLAILMPIVASMGGNATTQTQTVIIRGLALGQITKQNAWALLKKEATSGGFIGTILALVMAMAVGLIYQNYKLALVIAAATVANHLIAAAAGWATPLVLKRYKYDPAIATGVITTTFTDVGGFFVFLGLATLVLL
jgi:magnesium transporter